MAGLKPHLSYLVPLWLGLALTTVGGVLYLLNYELPYSLLCLGLASLLTFSAILVKEYLLRKHRWHRARDNCSRLLLASGLLFVVPLAVTCVLAQLLDVPSTSTVDNYVGAAFVLDVFLYIFVSVYLIFADLSAS